MESPSHSPPELAYHLLDISYDRFIHVGPAHLTPIFVPGKEHWVIIQQTVAAKLAIMAYPTFDGTLSKWKLFKNKFLDVSFSQ